MVKKNVKGGYMEKNTKRFFMFGILAIFMVMFAMQFVVATDLPLVDNTGVNAVITSPEWLVTFIRFLSLGETWAKLIVSLAILVMIFAAAYDILNFTAFESDWVKYSIAGAIAVVTAVTGWINWFAKFMMSIVGGSVAVATFVVIFLAILFFVGGSFFKGKIKKLKYKTQSEDVAGLMDLAAEANAGDIKKAKKALEVGK